MYTYVDIKFIFLYYIFFFPFYAYKKDLKN